MKVNKRVIQCVIINDIGEQSPKKREFTYYDENKNFLDKHTCELTNDGLWQFTSQEAGKVSTLYCPFFNGKQVPKCDGC